MSVVNTGLVRSSLLLCVVALSQFRFAGVGPRALLAARLLGGPSLLDLELVGNLLLGGLPARQRAFVVGLDGQDAVVACDRFVVLSFLQEPVGYLAEKTDADTGWVYPVVAAVLGAVFLVQAHRMWARCRGTEDLTVIKPMVLFHASNLYLSLLFVAVALDPLLTR